MLYKNLLKNESTSILLTKNKLLLEKILSFLAFFHLAIVEYYKGAAGPCDPNPCPDCPPGGGGPTGGGGGPIGGVKFPYPSQSIQI
ncbi:MULTISPECIES: hypothetical protein [Chryseobacterium]|uniref:hypothetical protein n=1 Tax=Chryseobacterium sp. R2A-55 TaxID=2744445 RepID=UPI001F339BCD|nr:hypothetical protein [Chryseobacterium sp. R2A-55]